MSSAQLLTLIVLLSCGLASSKSMDEALMEFLAVMNKIGTGRCLEFWGFVGIVQSAKGGVYFTLKVGLPPDFSTTKEQIK